MFPPFTGHGPCPKCGQALMTFWHDIGYSDWTAPPMGEARPCHEVQGWPQIEGGAVDPEDKAEEEHLHRVCDGCGYQAIEALEMPELRTPPGTKYAMVYGLKAVNEKAALGWRVIAGLMPGTDLVALMEAP